MSVGLKSITVYSSTMSIISMKIVILFFIIHYTTSDTSEEFTCARMILFFAPKDDPAVIRGQIVVYWFHRNFIRGSDLIALYDRVHPNPILTFDPVVMNGFRYTGIDASNISFIGESRYKEYCTGYYASWVRDGTEHKTTCLSTHPNWMNDSRDIFGDRMLYDMFIPGSHDSGAYLNDTQNGFINSITVTQDQTVLEQLISGVRYIDLRPAAYYYDYWVNHGIVAMNLMSDIINQVKMFLDNTNEIVILSFKEFPIGFYKYDHHNRFIQYLKKEFAGYYVSRPRKESVWSVTLNYIWNKNKRLILSYDYSPIQNTTLYLWPPIQQQWGDASNIEDLLKYISLVESRGDFHHKARESRAVMAAITLTTLNVVTDWFQNLFNSNDESLKKNAVAIGPALTKSYNEKWYEYANIVAVDFIEATGIVEVAIEWNKRLSPAYELDMCSPECTSIFN